MFPAVAAQATNGSGLPATRPCARVLEDVKCAIGHGVKAARRYRARGQATALQGKSAEAKYPPLYVVARDGSPLRRAFRWIALACLRKFAFRFVGLE